ncbi:ATP-dependent DNA ligase [Streptomyces albogriseolus]|uniref:ATP-dependent DNA ligase n=1 Tax=Streptomyces albogriseolus TaxID=1887 RepID=UPI0022556192|nr:ATP-dependent DNA ligase [Streptomyces viridodiastaticus]MCX4618021.1 ATP-dependent DNA ligase [Streptomyces viridodiastaticus]
MVLIPPVQPMLVETGSELSPARALPGGLAFEQRPDGYRALLCAGPGGHAHLQSRNGTDLSPAFPEIAAADRALRVPLVLDGELLVTAEGRLDFGQLHQRALRRGADARLAARDHPAYLIVFDILDTADGPLLDEPYRARRALLEEPFAHGVPADPFVLCSATIDRATAEDCLNPAWGAAGIEGIVVKGLAQRYQPGRIKVRAHASAEAVVAAVTGRVTAPSTLLLGRYDARGRLRFIAQTAPLSATARREVGGLLFPGDDNHPWEQRRFPPAQAPARPSTTGRSSRTSSWSSPGTPRSMPAATGTRYALAGGACRQGRAGSAGVGGGGRRPPPRTS